MKIKNIVLSLIVCSASAQIFSDEQVVENIEQVATTVQPLVKKHVIAEATEANAEEVQASDVVATEDVVTEEIVAAEEVAQN